jgi:hypothetical protein
MTTATKPTDKRPRGPSESDGGMIPNALGRLIPREVNGREAVPFKGVGKHEPAGRKQAPPIRSCRDYPADGGAAGSRTAWLSPRTTISATEIGWA